MDYFVKQYGPRVGSTSRSNASYCNNVLYFAHKFYFFDYNAYY